MSTTPLATVTSFKPVVLSAAADRGADLEVSVTAPATGDLLPVVVFSPGFAWSMDGYGPLVDVWAAGGFAVVQPTHLDAATLGLAPDDPRTPLVWRHRIADLVAIIDQLDLIDAAVPGLGGRLDHDQIAVAGHSYGATSASALLGARVIGADGEVGEDFTDSRVRAGVLLALAGTGGEDLTPFAAQMFPFMNPAFATMEAPALIVAGDADQSPLSVRGPEWWTDAFELSPGPKSLLRVAGAQHSLGGIPAYAGMAADPSETPEQLALVQQVTTAYLEQALGHGGASWAEASAGVATHPSGRLTSK